MLSFKDFFHLPQVEPIIDTLTHERSGLIVIAGMNPRAHMQPEETAGFPASGRAGIFRILVREILEANKTLKATIIAENRAAFRVPRGLSRKVHFEPVKSPQDYVDIIPAAAQHRDRILVVDKLTPENAAFALGAAQKGSRVITQMDTIFRGAEVARALLDWGIPRGRISGLRWVVSMQRIAMLCNCKLPAPPDGAIIDAVQQRYPHLRIDPDAAFFATGSCKDCEHTGRRNEITAFDFYRSNPDLNASQPRLYPLEAYMLGLAENGSIPLSDLLRIESNQLHQTYQLLTASEGALSDVRTTLERKIVELEAANRVLRNRTEELVSLQEIGQALIGMTSLRDLARQVCRQASLLCGADRAVFYFLRDSTHADVLATHGWEPGRVPQRVRASRVCDPGSEPTPSRYNDWPPGVKPRHPDVEGARLRAGLRVPLIAQGNPVGAMLVHSTTKARFQPGAVALLQTFANQAAIAIQRADLIESLQVKLAELEAAQAGLAQKERMDRELELARDVQQAMLPHQFPEVPGYRFAARYRPARQVGGDFYDVIDLGPDRFGLVVADVSDKGMPAAVYMALTRSLLVAEARRSNSPVAVLGNVNDLLLELGRARMFVTVFYGVVEIAAGLLTYARAGHDRPLLMRAGKANELSGEGVFLGFVPSNMLHISEESTQLEPDDRLVLYTDGLIDVSSPQGERLKRSGLQNLLERLSHLPADDFCEAVFETLVDYQGIADQYDDMTILALDVETSP
jgi:sigma-B regulation protein RsbU (phosphoserine phosphatase)